LNVPLPTPGKSPDPDIKSRETVRIQLPVSRAHGKLPLHNPTELVPPAGSTAQDLHPSQFSPPLSASVMPAPESPDSGLKKETLRVPLVSEPPVSQERIEKSAYAHATRCSAEFLNRCRVAREKLNAAYG